MTAIVIGKDGSMHVTRDDGATLDIPAGKQAVTDAAITAFVGAVAADKPTLEDLLVAKGILTAQDIATIKEK